MALTLTAGGPKVLDELRPHVGLFPRVGMYPSPYGLAAATAGVLSVPSASPAVLTLTAAGAGSSSLTVKTPGVLTLVAN